MARWGYLEVLVVLIGLNTVSGAREIKSNHGDMLPVYNHTLAKILVEYASAVYMTDLTALFTWTCSRCDGLTKNCLQAFVGVAHDLNSIIIAFRGTQAHSIRNWIEDLFWKQLDLNYPGMPNAMVHHGFYSAYHNTTLRHQILCALQKTRELYGNIPVMITGHSMGGALASFCALDLTVNHGIQDVQVITFGQPRIGNAVFASYFMKHVPLTVRVTHQNDIVPHLPPYYSYFPQKTYHHFPREVWLRDIEVDSLDYLVERICDGSGEDPTCSRSVSGNSVLDHLRYYNVEVKADDPGSCKIVMDNSVTQYHTEYNGSIILSKDPGVPLSVKIEMPASVNSGSSSSL